MAAVVLPDLEQVVIDYLRADTAVDAEVGDRIFVEKPSTAPTEPYVIVTALGGTVAIPRRLDAARIQIDVWGGSRWAAKKAARVIRAAMWEAHKATHTGAVVTGIEEELGPSWLPDPVDAGKRLKPRYTQSHIVYAHP